MTTENPTARTSRTRVFNDTWLKGKGPKAAPEWADQGRPGLRLRSASMAFFYRFKIDGKVDKITLGHYHPVDPNDPDPDKAFTLANARDKWEGLNALRKKGINPKTHLEEQAEADRQAELDEAQRQTATVARLVAIISPRSARRLISAAGHQTPSASLGKELSTT